MSSAVRAPLLRCARFLAGLAALTFAVLMTDCKPETPALYYRITTDLETEGQPFQLDVVVQCRGLEVVRSLGGSGHLNFTQVPYLYGRPTSAGHAVLMRVPNFCGLIASGEKVVQARNAAMKERMNLPLILWAADKDNLSRMTAYTSLSGYEGEGSQLRYIGSRYVETTRDEWLAWKTQNERPFITRSTDPIYEWKVEGGRQARGPEPLRCFGIRLNPIPDTLRPIVDAARPVDHPLVWTDRALFHRIYPEALAAEGTNVARAVSEMSFTSGSSGVGVLPYEATNVRRGDEPLASDYPDNEWVTLARVNLDSPIRGRADCRRTQITFPQLIVITRAGESGHAIATPHVFVGDTLVLDFVGTDHVHIIEGSYEGLDP